MLSKNLKGYEAFKAQRTFGKKVSHLIKRSAYHAAQNLPGFAIGGIASAASSYGFQKAVTGIDKLRTNVRPEPQYRTIEPRYDTRRIRQINRWVTARRYKDEL